MCASWFGGQRRNKNAAAAPVAPLPQIEPMPRMELIPDGEWCGAGCDERVGFRCAYRDDSGNRCGWWCKHHAVIFDGRAWCRRHANSTRWLSARGGSVLEVSRQPHVNDRSPNLVGILVDEYNDEVIAHLRSCFEDCPGIQIVTDEGIRSSSIPKGRVERTADGPVILSEGSHLSWARGWAAYSEVGYVVRVVLQVTAGEPPVVHLYVNGHSVLNRVPDWIANRAARTDALQDRARFRQIIMDGMRAAVAARLRTLDLDALRQGRRQQEKVQVTLLPDLRR